MLILVYTLIGVTIATTLISLIGPNVDLAIAHLFYDPAIGRFVAHHQSFMANVRENGRVVIISCALVVLLGLSSFLPWRLPSIRPRTAIALTLGLLLGPGLLVNGIFKPYGGRPRPGMTTDFGGGMPFVDWWNPTGECPGNCSFMSGEAATAAWMFGPAMLAPPPWRAAAIIAAALFTSFVSVLRLAGGGHFLSDAIIGALSTIVILLAMFRVLHVRRTG